MKDIEELLNNYFEGETTCEEERELCHFFTQGIVPEHLQIYRPMFAFIDAENTLYHQSTVKTRKKKSIRRVISYSLGGIAAGLLLLLGISGVCHYLPMTPDNYVIIDGKRYTDTELVHEQALSAFQDVRLSEEEVFATLFEE